MKIDKRIFVLLGVLSLPGWCAADLTLTGYSTVGSFGMPMSSQERVMIDGSEVRRDFVDRGRAYTHLFDLGKRTVTVIDHGARTAEIYNLETLRSDVNVKTSENELKLELTPSGRQQSLMKWQCHEYTVKASMPAKLGNEDAIFHMDGKIWLAQGVPEQSQVKRLVKMVREPDFFLAAPSVARMMPAQAEAMNEIIRKMASRGLPCSGEVEVSYEGNGPMASLAKRMPTRLGFTFQSYTTEPVSSDAFAIPRGYLVLNPKTPPMVLPGSMPGMPNTTQ
jgi:hypothetical protein